MSFGIRKAGAFLPAAFALCVSLIFAGCSAPAEETASEPEAPPLEASEIIGTWVVERSGSMTLEKGLEEGTLQWMTFGEGDAFVLTVQTMDAPLARTGTYRIEGDKAYVNVPALPEQPETTEPDDALSLSTTAIEDGEIAFEGETLTTSAIGKEGTVATAKKVTEEQLQAYIAQVVAMAPQPIAVGETVEDEDFSVTLTGAAIMPTLESADSRTYWEADDGTTFVILEFDIEALNSNEISVDSGAVSNVVGTFNGNTYKGWDYKYVVSELWLPGKNRYFEANMPVHMYVYTSVPAAAEGGGFTVDMEVAGQSKQLSL